MLARLMRLWLLFELCACLGLGLVWHALLAWSWGRVFLSLVLLALLLRLLVVLTTQWLAVWLNPQTRLLTRYPLALWLRSLAQEWLAFSVIQASMSWPQFMPRRDCNRPREPGQQVLLLVHGYGCNRGFWWWLKPRLEARGLQVATLTLEPLLGSISGYTEQLAQRVNRLCQETGAARVWLVGHSMGGLACLAYLARYGEARVQGLITLGSPHGGTHMARLGPGRNCEEMRPGSLWLRQLADDFALLPLRVPLIAAWSPLDNLMVPPAVARCGNGLDIELPPMGHLGMGCAPAVCEAIVATVTVDWSPWLAQMDEQGDELLEEVT